MELPSSEKLSDLLKIKQPARDGAKAWVQVFPTPNSATLQDSLIYFPMIYKVMLAIAMQIIVKLLC